MARVVLGGGCFWCVESALSGLKGVTSLQPAYAGGSNSAPTYEQVCRGNTGHAEVVLVEFDTAIISFETLLEVFFTIHDPSQLNRQGNDVGSHYRTCIMPLEDGQEECAQSIIEQMQEHWPQAIVTTIEEATNLTIAEQYHHDYFAKNPDNRYCQAVINPKLAKVRARFAHLF